MKPRILFIAAALTLAALPVRAQAVLKVEDAQDVEAKAKELALKAVSYYPGGCKKENLYGGVGTRGIVTREKCKPFVDHRDDLYQRLAYYFDPQVHARRYSPLQNAEFHVSRMRGHASHVRDNASLALELSKTYRRKSNIDKWESEAVELEQAAQALEQAAQAWEQAVRAWEGRAALERRREAEAAQRKREAEAAQRQAAQRQKQQARPVVAAYEAQARAWDAEADFDFVEYDGFNEPKQSQAAGARINAARAEGGGSFAREQASRANLHALRARENASDWRSTAGRKTGGLKELANKAAQAWESAAQAWDAVGE